MEQPVLNLLGHSCFHATEPWARELSLISSLQPKPCEDTVWFSCCRGEVLCPCLAVGSAHIKVAQAGFWGSLTIPGCFPPWVIAHQPPELGFSRCSLLLASLRGGCYLREGRCHGSSQARVHFHVGKQFGGIRKMSSARNSLASLKVKAELTWI